MSSKRMLTTQDVEKIIDEHGGGTGGVSKAYVDQQDAATLASAKEYADSKTSGLATESYADEKASQALSDAQSYADTKVSEESAARAVSEASLESKIDEKSVVTVEQILTEGTEVAKLTVNGTETTLYAPAGGSGGEVTKEYVDGQDEAVLSDAKSYADTAASNAETNANSYTDGKVSGLATETYADTVADTAKTNAVSEANSYTDTEVANKSKVEFTQTLTEGTAIGDITIDGNTTTLYAPAGGSGGEVSKEYVDQQDETTLNDAKDYTDEKVAEKSHVEVVQTITEGTAIGEINIDGSSTTLYAPEGGSTGGITKKVITADGTDYTDETGATVTFDQIKTWCLSDSHIVYCKEGGDDKTSRVFSSLNEKTDEESGEVTGYKLVFTCGTMDLEGNLSMAYIVLDDEEGVGSTGSETVGYHGTYIESYEEGEDTIDITLGTI